MKTTATTSSTSFVDTGITATITPSSASHKILVLASVNNGIGGTSAATFLTLADGSNNNLIDPTSPGNRTASFTRRETQAILVYDNFADCLVFDHSPATTSAFTYKILYRVESGGTATINRSSNDTDA